MGEEPNHPEYLLIKGRIQTLDGRYETARRTLRQAIEYLKPNRPNYDRILSQYRIELSNVDIREQGKILHDETSNAVEELETLREKYKESSERFQTRMLQFLGFFTGIIGIIVIAAQVTISVDSAANAASLILILIGGLLFAFGGFSFLLPNYQEDDINIRIIGVFVSGAILMITGGSLL